MLPRRFSLLALFVAVLCACVAMWAVSTPNNWRWGVATMLFSFLGACFAISRGRSVVRLATACGAASGIPLIACKWSVFLLGYFQYDARSPYFQDGFVIEAFVYPIMYCVIFAPAGALIGLAVGCAVWCVASASRRPTRHGRRAESPSE